MKALEKLADWMNGTGSFLSNMKMIEQYGNYWTQLQIRIKIKRNFWPSQPGILCFEIDRLIAESLGSLLQPYFEVFGRDKFHFVDGGAIVKDPTPEFAKIQAFFGLENELDFKFNRTKGFSCLHRPVPYCLSAAKGLKKLQFQNNIRKL